MLKSTYDLQDSEMADLLRAYRARREQGSPSIEASQISKTDSLKSRRGRTSHMRRESVTFLSRNIEAFKNEPYNPEIITALWKEFLPNAAATLPPLHWSSQDIAAPMIGIEGDEQAGIMVPVPDRYTGQNGLIRLGKWFPRMENYSVQKDTPIGSDERPGIIWTKIEASLDAPNRNTTEAELTNHFALQGSLGQRLETYILGSQFMRAVTGKFFDQRTYSRLPGSHSSGNDVVDARFFPVGSLSVLWNMKPQHNHLDIGGRSEEVK